MSQPTFDLSSIRYVHRMVVGTSNPNNPASEEEVSVQMELLNRCLNEVPRGSILGLEKNFSLFNLGEHQVVLQWMVYHIGFTRKPGWL
ncbi:hypothetical protein C4J81_19125 (plasmid) [Deltaproteobacteria bacterium Smac51]|nr:hypothetical protein C4J81_19125 [Deltaproteobacteria bacterium Smac51]